MDAYSHLSDAYDALMADVDYNEWAGYLHALLKKANVKRVYEAGCGTGSMTFALYRRGYDIVASDISPAMLKTAKTRARREGLDILFVIQDMKHITVGNSVDAIVCVCDGPNYLNEDGLSLFASSAYNALQEHGVLLFDISTKYKLAGLMDGEVYFDDSDDTVCVWKNHYDQERGTLVMDVTLFLRRGELFERFDEQHVQYAHDTENVRKIMLSAGFSSVEALEWPTFQNHRENAERVQFICTKESP